MEIFKLFGKIVLDGAEDAEKALGKIGSVAAKAGKAIISGIGAGSAAVAALGKSAVSNYADYEQLVGGVETLFKNSSSAVLSYAENAYKTAGLSANEYMDTVTSFSASLLQSLDGDTEKAVQVANRAITDMADNANKMGTDIASIQNAYQGFAKQNYTMLDNLKLGYGGTKEEMERLIADANKLKAANGEMADLSIDSYADIVKAIGLVQDEMGITGTTALESSTTIQGSIAAMKSSWSNLLTALTSEDMDIGTYLNNFVKSAKTALDNIAPRIQQFFKGFGKLVSGLAPIISKEIPGLIKSLLPGLIDGAAVMLDAIVASLPELLQSIIPSLIQGIVTVAESLITELPAILSALLDSVKILVGSLFDEISLKALNTGVSFESVFSGIQAVFESCWTVIRTIWETFGEPVWNSTMERIEAIRDAFAAIMPEVKEFVSSCFTDIKEIWETALKPCFDAIKSILQNVLLPTFDYVFRVVIGPVVESVFTFIKDMWNGTLKPVFTGITDFLTGVFTLNFSQAFEGLISIVKGIWNGIVTVVKTPINEVIKIINNFISGLNTLKIPDWVPGIGGKGINIAMIPELAKGGVLERGQTGLLEGNGAEAVVPLDQNSAWISAVAKDMENAGIGGNSQQAQRIIELLETLLDVLPETMTAAFSSMKFDVNNREFARLVKAVN
nr:MAG TPA: tail tape measure protein [Bacteriophage sp.]